MGSARASSNLVGVVFFWGHFCFYGQLGLRGSVRKQRSRKIAPGGTRTRNLCLRRAAPYPLGHRSTIRNENQQKKQRKKHCPNRGSNSGPRACEARVITNYTIRTSVVRKSITCVNWQKIHTKNKNCAVCGVLRGKTLVLRSEKRPR